ncbi:MAG: 2-succinyl-5-enolpyruvyl-6-hydroxy-3-cyclohexene-1-carboxylic-acid synthase [Muribaculaceae bacterium]|nr:2-succinyl-5-enolpyruvyl-6-hydroxy-3-cyclohexene-1-carboxylic-acid synthase [Muribaculaceae bacterium]
MKDTSKKFCRILFDVLSKKGVEDIVCSPGSRNVPLLLAAAARTSMKKHFVVDERSAAFMGLGLALVSQKPVAVICTSGTALLNYAPAVAEAYYQSVPLIVISADRPIQWIDQDDSQTLRQDGALDNYVKKSYSIPAIGENDEEMLWYVNRIANDALSYACGGRPGPVHINIHLAEPLGLKQEHENEETRIIRSISADSIGNKEVVKDLAGKICKAKVMLVAGFGTPDSQLQKAIASFSKFENVVVMAETISNLHLNEEDYSVDSTLTAFESQDLDNISPDIVISIGGALISRKLKDYLRKNSHKILHWSVGFSLTTSDPFMSLDLRIETDPTRFFRNINVCMRKLGLTSDVKKYKKEWSVRRLEAKYVKNNFIKNCGWSELKAFELILNYLPAEYNLFLSNGTSIRYAQLINYPLPHASYCNRGVSGIDGSISTAIGGSIAYKGKTLIITGDLSMAYDIGSLGIQEIPHSFKIIVIDNQGGGIFRFIPSTSSLPEREEYLCQAPLLPLNALAQGYNWEFMEVSDINSLKHILPKFFSYPTKAILKVSCPGEESAEILKNYMNLKVI